MRRASPSATSVDTGLVKDAPRGREILVRNRHPARDGADGAFDDGRMGVEHRRLYPGVGEQGADPRNLHGVVGAQ